MIERSIVTLVLASLPILAQQPATYVAASYAKWKPGMAEEGRKFNTEVANKAVFARNKVDPSHLGQVRLYRVFPTGHEAGHDILRLVFRSAPPDFSVTATPAAHLAGTGLTPAEFSSKLAAISETVKAEIWSSVFRHGSIGEGDFVRVSFQDPPKDLTAEHAEFQREYSSGMAEHLVKGGALKGWDAWRLLLAPNAAPYNAVSITVHKDSASLFKGLGKQTDAFYAAHPKGDYNRYLTRSREVTNSVKTVVYRVDSAIWK
jgi:hypothetical protein